MLPLLFPYYSQCISAIRGSLRDDNFFMPKSISDLRESNFDLRVPPRGAPLLFPCYSKCISAVRGSLSYSHFVIPKSNFDFRILVSDLRIPPRCPLCYFGAISNTISRIQHPSATATCLFQKQFRFEEKHFRFDDAPRGAPFAVPVLFQIHFRDSRIPPGLSLCYFESNYHLRILISD